MGRFFREACASRRRGPLDAPVQAELATPGRPYPRRGGLCRYAVNRLLDLPSCVGYHLCGAYLKNNARRYGFRDARNRLEPHVEAMTRANRAAEARFKRETA